MPMKVPLQPINVQQIDKPASQLHSSSHASLALQGALQLPPSFQPVTECPIFEFFMIRPQRLVIQSGVH